MFARVSLLRSSLRIASFSTKSTGTVKWFDVKKGYGFIVPSSGEPEIFVHQVDIKTDGFRSLRGNCADNTICRLVFNILNCVQMVKMSNMLRKKHQPERLLPRMSLAQMVPMS